MDDTWLQESIFVDHMEEMLGDKLYGHDEKKIVMKTDMGKLPDDSELQKMNAKIRGFYFQIAASIKNVFGYVTLNNFNKYLKQIVKE